MRGLYRAQLRALFRQVDDAAAVGSRLAAAGAMSHTTPDRSAFDDPLLVHSLSLSPLLYTDKNSWTSPAPPGASQPGGYAAITAADL